MASLCSALSDVVLMLERLHAALCISAKAPFEGAAALAILVKSRA